MHDMHRLPRRVIRRIGFYVCVIAIPVLRMTIPELLSCETRIRIALFLTQTYYIMQRKLTHFSSEEFCNNSIFVVILDCRPFQICQTLPVIRLQYYSIFLRTVPTVCSKRSRKTPNQDTSWPGFSMLPETRYKWGTYRYYSHAVPYIITKYKR
jgi:hypothetical protein